MQKDSFIARWSQFFITRYKTTILVVLALTIAGVWGVLNNQRQDFPPIPTNFVQVQAIWPGASVQDIEQQVIVPLEEAVETVEEVGAINGNASDNAGFIVVELADASDIDGSVIDIEKAVNDTLLPTDVEVEVAGFDVVGPSLLYALTSDSLSQRELLTLASTVQERLQESSNELAGVEILPENTFAVEVKLDQDAMEDEGVTYQDVNGALQSSLSSIPGGGLEKKDGQTVAITIDPAVDSIKELKTIAVGDVELKDIASITRAPEQKETITLAGFVDENGVARSEEAVYLSIEKKDTGDVITMSEEVAAEVEAILSEEVLPGSVSLNKLYDNSESVESQISDLVSNGVLGLVLILLVLMLFINLRTGIVVALIIPMAFLATLAVLYAIGYTINILTLFALILVLGILVDNAIVIAEGIMHAIENGKTRAEAVATTMKNLGPAVTAATLTTIVVFIPFASIGGIIGEFLKFIPYTIIIMLVMSYGLAITITPVLARYILKEETKEQRTGRKLSTWQYVLILPALVYLGQKLVDGLEHVYVVFTKWIHASRIAQTVVLGGALVLIAASSAMFGSQLDVEEFPPEGAELAQVDIEFPNDTSFDEQLAVTNRVMDIVIETEHFRNYLFIEGQLWVTFQNPEDPETVVNVYDKSDEIDAAWKDVKEELAAREIYLSIGAAGVGPPTSAFDVTVDITGEGDFRGLAADIEQFMLEQEAADRVVNSMEENRVDSVRVALDSEKIKDEGVDSFVASAAVNSVFGQSTAGTLPSGQNGLSEDVVVSYSDSDKRTLKQLRDIVVGVNGELPPEPVELRDIADVEEERTLSAVSRLDGDRVASIQATAKNEDDVESFKSAVEEYVSSEKLAEYGFDEDAVSFGGVDQDAAENFESLQLVFMLAIIAVYLILVYQFNSFLQPLTILFTIPLALIGVFPGLFVIDSSINMISGLGIIALVGIVVNDAIVFVDYYNRLKRENADWSLAEVVVATGRARFKPILSTSITTIFGILPLTINDAFWRGLGTSLITGLICSTLGTLIVFPVLLRWLSTSTSWSARMCRLVGKKMRRA
jgi:HAE1 family hydrophobic/amphiphilic exporter-1